jgi:hypothetical protein
MADFLSKLADPSGRHILSQSPQEFRNEVRELLGGTGKFTLDGIAPAGVKIVGLRNMSLVLEAHFPRGKEYDERQKMLAAAILSQMPHGELGTLGVAYFQTFSGVRGKPWKEMNNASHIRDANLVVARFITPADLQRYLSDDGQSILRTSAPVEDKLDYIMALYRDMSSAARSGFLRNGYDERQKVLIRAAVGQLKWMADAEHRAGSEEYGRYVSALARTFGIDENKVKDFVHNGQMGNNKMLEFHLAHA